MRYVFILCGLILASATTMAEPEIKGSPNELKQFLHPRGNVVTLFGHAEKKAYSDQAIISLVVTTEEKQLSKAIANNQTLRQQLTKKLKASGINASAIKSSKFSSSPQYGWFGKKPASFKVVNRVAVTISEERHMTAVASIADQHREIELSDTSFEHSKKDEMNLTVKKMALDKIKSQKAFYEKSLGVSLSTVGIRDSNIRQQATRGARMLKQAMVAQPEAMMYDSAPMAASRPAPSTPSFDEVKYEANLSVDFKIAP